MRTKPRNLSTTGAAVCSNARASGRASKAPSPAIKGRCAKSARRSTRRNTSPCDETSCRLSTVRQMNSGAISLTCTESNPPGDAITAACSTEAISMIQQRMASRSNSKALMGKRSPNSVRISCAKSGDAPSMVKVCNWCTGWFCTLTCASWTKPRR